MAAAWPLTGRSAQLELLGQWYADPDTGGAVVVGPAGVGKTRLAEELVRLAQEAGRPVARAIGHPATAPIPFGALAHLLPADPVGVELGDDERAALFHVARTALVRLAAGDRLVLAVDDVDQLDTTSLALLVPLVVQRNLFLVATIRSGRPAPSAIETLVKDGYLGRLDIGPLGSDDVATLLHRVLDGPLDDAALARLTELSGGNLQVLAELLRGARERGSLVRDRQMWRLGDLPATSGLEELVQRHLEGVSGDGRRALELLAVAGRLGLLDLETACPMEVIEALEADGLVTATSSGRRTEVALSHPLYGEVLRAGLPLLRRRAIQRQLADLIEGHGARRREDPARLALWRLEAGGAVAAELLVQAARLALAGRDAVLAERFGRALRDRGAMGDSAVVLAEAASLQGDLPALEMAVRAVRDGDVDDRQRAQLARRLADLRFSAGADVDSALEVNAEAMAAVADRAARATLVAHRAGLLAAAGRPVEALAASEEVDVVDDPRARAELYATRATALLSVGRATEAVEAAQAGTLEQEKLPAWIGRRGTARHIVNQAHALAYSGHYREARALMEPAAERARQAKAWAAWLWFEMVLAEIARDCGRGQEAVDRFQAVADAAQQIGQAAALIWAHVGVAQGHLLLGDADAAEPALVAADALGHSPVATSTTTRERCRAWLEACRGDLRAARERLGAAADASRTDGVYVFELALRHDLVRFGDAAGAVARVEELAAVVEGPLGQGMVAHARGVAASDPAELERAVSQFEAIDALVLAAEAAADLSDAWRRQGDQRQGAAAMQRSVRLARMVGGARTPPLLRGEGVEPLTSREREVALLAAQGWTSRDIAGRLFLSARTVDTHLARVYRKLGVSGREDLAGALAGAAADTP